eukprot:gene29275-36435_t
MLGSDVNISNSRLHHSYAFSGGGSLYIEQSNVTLVEILSASHMSPSYGSNIFCKESSLNCHTVWLQEGVCEKGGGVAAVHSDVLLYNVTIQDNYADESGGGIVLWKGTVLDAKNCTLDNNTAWDGGAIGAYFESTSTFTNVRMVHNHAFNNGGAVYIEYHGIMSLTGVVLANNSGGYGGAMNLLYCRTGGEASEVIVGSEDRACLVMNDCVLSNNRAKFLGGAMGISSSSVVMQNVTLDSNKAVHGGAICMLPGNASSYVYNPYGTLSEESVLFAANVSLTYNAASDEGGAVYLSNLSHANITDCRLAGNSAQSDLGNVGGGALALSRALSCRLANLVLEDNVARHGGGVYIGELAFNVSMQHINFTNNLANSGSSLFWVGDFPTPSVA